MKDKKRYGGGVRSPLIGKDDVKAVRRALRRKGVGLDVILQHRTREIDSLLADVCEVAADAVGVIAIVVGESECSIHATLPNDIVLAQLERAKYFILGGGEQYDDGDDDDEDDDGGGDDDDTDGDKPSQPRAGTKTDNKRVREATL